MSITSCYKRPILSRGLAFLLLVSVGNSDTGIIRATDDTSKMRQYICPNSTVQYTLAGTKCLAYVSQPVSWETARNYCRQLRPPAELVKITSQGQNDNATSIIKNNSWIGLKSGILSGWKWLDESVIYKNWAPDRNADNEWFGREPCAEIRTDGKWNDVSCELGLPFVCEIQAGKTHVEGKGISGISYVTIRASVIAVSVATTHSSTKWPFIVTTEYSASLPTSLLPLHKPDRTSSHSGSQRYFSMDIVGYSLGGMIIVVLVMILIIFKVMHCRRKQQKNPLEKTSPDAGVTTNNEQTTEICENARFPDRRTEAQIIEPYENMITQTNSGGLPDTHTDEMILVDNELYDDTRTSVVIANQLYEGSAPANIMVENEVYA